MPYKNSGRNNNAVVIKVEAAGTTGIKFSDSLQRNFVDIVEWSPILAMPTGTASIISSAKGALKKHGNQAVGVSRGGKTIKIHALVTENFQLIGILLAGGNIHDLECVTELLSKVQLEGKTVLGDKAFCSEKIRDFIRAQKRQFVFPTRPIHL